MNTNKKFDIYSLKGDYYTGFQKIKHSLKSDIIPSSFKKEVEDDLLELFLRNQEMDKDFNQVIGGDMDEFISGIIEAYVTTVPKKYLYLDSLCKGLTFSAVVSAFSFIQRGSSLASLFISGTSIIYCILLYFILYKFSVKNFTFISCLSAFVFIAFEKLFFENINFMHILSTYPINPTVYFLIIGIEIGLVLILQRLLKIIN